MKDDQRGFVKAILITVFVIVLILGALIFVVLKSLNSARKEVDTNQKQVTEKQTEQNLDGTDVKQAIINAEKKAEIKNNDSQLKGLLSQVRTDAEIIYNAKSSYSSVCSSSTHLNDINTRLSNKAKCVAVSDYYLVEVPLSQGSFCVDSTGYFGVGTVSSSGKTCLRN